jgi:aminoglycoside 3-N-acetyltransferase
MEFFWYIERLIVMYNKQELLNHLKELGINENGTLLVHSSMKSIGQVEGGADTVLDALSEYMKNGLLV